MNMHISNSGRVGEIANVGNSNRLQARPGFANMLSASSSVNFESIQRSLNANKGSVNATSGASSQMGGAPLSSASSKPPAPNSAFDFPHLTTLQKIGPYEPLTIKSFYGEPPAGLDRSGLSGIIDKSGNNLSNQEIADFFNGNPTTSEIAQMRLHLGLNEYQEARAISVWRGVKYAEPIWVPEGASTIGGTSGGETTGNGPPAPATGAWGNAPSSLLANNYQETVTLAASSSPARNPTA